MRVVHKNHKQATWVFSILCIAIIFIAPLAGRLETIKADSDFSWIAAAPSVVYSQTYTEPISQNLCRDINRLVKVAGEAAPSSVCITHTSDKVRFGIRFLNNAYRPLISIGSDSQMYRINMTCSNRYACLYLADYDALAYINTRKAGWIGRILH